MAGPKLTAERREELKSELRDRIENGQTVARIVREMSGKYSIRTNSIRFHLARLDAPRRSRRAVPSRVAIETQLKAEITGLIERTYKLSLEHLENAKAIRNLQLRLAEVFGGRGPVEVATPSPRRARGPRFKDAPPSEPAEMTFARRVRELRREAGITLEVAAMRIGTHKGYVSGIETGKVPPPSPRFVRKFAEVYGVDEKELLRLAQVEKIPPAIRGEVRRAFWPAAAARTPEPAGSPPR